MAQCKTMKNIGVFFGSSTPEHDVSIITGQTIISGLRGLGYQVTPIYLTKKRAWLIGDDLGSLNDFTTQKPEANKKNQYYLELGEPQGKMVFKPKSSFGKNIEIDLAFPAFHGSYGEDGTMQGLFEIIGVPYVGCDVTASATTMDKAITKALYEQAKIPTTKYFSFLKEEWEADKSEILEKAKSELQFPVFIKPVHLGSSIGIVKVDKADDKELELAIEPALFYDHKVLIEEGVQNLADITCCVIGNKDLRASLLQESVFQSELLDFDEKYLKDGGAQTGESETSVVIPANVDEETTKQIRELAKKIYKLFGCSGIARVDFLYNRKTKQIFANEINTLPGTVYHHLWKASGLELGDLLAELVKFAEERFDERQKLNYAFESSILTGLNSGKKGGAKTG